jgi:hypothetical protein
MAPVHLANPLLRSGTNHSPTTSLRLGTWYGLNLNSKRKLYYVGPLFIVQLLSMSGEVVSPPS